VDRQRENLGAFASSELASVSEAKRFAAPARIRNHGPVSEGEPKDEQADEPDEPNEPKDGVDASPDVEPRGDVEGIGEAPDAVFSALWARVLEAWDEEKPHQAALSYAIEKEMLPEIAGRYRKLIDDPEKGARAKKKIDGIVVAATQLLLATKSPVREKVPWQWTASAAVFMVIVVSFLAYKILGQR